MESRGVTVLITCAIKAELLATARQELDAVIRTVMSEEQACHGITVHEDPTDPRRLMIIERWESQEIFMGPHMQTPHMQAFLKRSEDFLDGAAQFGFWRQVSST